ncbi:hypothetical protein ACJRO7_033582 [Eucalyptus globulus]|uniref:Uncharacterized protein n=1 Tax=Eucalyptus globulus TaxID=34317 RepID=A0ABD3JRZ5_EUCGL
MDAMPEAVKEKELAARRQELLLHPPRRGRIKRLVFECLFGSLEALVGRSIGFLLGRNRT